MGMKKLYFLNEEESKRILNLHKDATKRQYLSEQQDVYLSGSEGVIKGPLVTQIQQILKQKGINLGKTGVDGVMGNITLNGIISALGAETSTPKTTTTATATSTGSDAGKNVGGTNLSSNPTSTGGGPG
jgi:peptidoglycan hydrolase-like protein with peptidoglycan-binding domain